jgi:hypothetical protein
MQYCSVRCQREHWKDSHKRTREELKAEPTFSTRKALADANRRQDDVRYIR